VCVCAVKVAFPALFVSVGHVLWYSSVSLPFHGKTPEVPSISWGTPSCGNVYKSENEEEVGSERKWLKYNTIAVHNFGHLSRDIENFSRYFKIVRYSVISCGTHNDVLRNPGCETVVFCIKVLNAIRVVIIGEVWHSICVKWSQCKDKFRPACFILCIVRPVELCKTDVKARRLYRNKIRLHRVSRMYKSCNICLLIPFYFLMKNLRDWRNLWLPEWCHGYVCFVSVVLLMS